MVSALLRRRLLRAATGTIVLGLLLAVAMQASRVLAPLAAARASWLELLAALAVVAVLALPTVVALGAGLAAALVIAGMAADGARDALRAHGVGPLRAARGALAPALGLAVLGLASSAWLEPLAARLALSRGADLAVRAALAALEQGAVLPLGDDGAIALERAGAPRPVLVVASGPDGEGTVVALRAELEALVFASEARLGRGALHVSRSRPSGLRTSLSFARARWPLASAGGLGGLGDRFLPERALSRGTLELAETAARDDESRALLFRRILPALLALGALLAPVLLGWSWARPGAGFVLALGVLPSVVGLGIARGLEHSRPAGLAELVALAAFGLAVGLGAGVRRFALGRRAGPRRRSE